MSITDIRTLRWFSGRTGEYSPWAFYSWNVTLTQRGLQLAARALLDALGSFGTTQLASYGYTGLPLLSACVIEGGGKYTGLSIREKRKSSSRTGASTA